MRWAAILVLFGAGCTDLAGYATGPNDVFRGSVIGAEDPSIVRRGFAPNATMDLTFDPENAMSLDPLPGRISTSDGALTEVSLEPIAPLSHDVLSELELPGGQLRNYIFVTHPASGPMMGREPMVFVSLMQDGRIEVRVIAGTGGRPGDYYGFFRLLRMPR